MKAISIFVLAFAPTLAVSGGLAVAGSLSEPAASVAASPPSHTALPAGLRLAFYDALAKQAGTAGTFDKAGCATLTGQPLEACSKSTGMQFNWINGAQLHLSLAAWGRKGDLAEVAPVAPQRAGRQVQFIHDGITEWWRTLPMGFEQGFTIAERPQGDGALVLALAASSQASQDGETLSWNNLRYGELVVTDANGHAVPAALTTSGNHILITVNDADAAYPIIVDPLVWLAQAFSSPDANSSSNFGGAVAIDGDTALVGASTATVDSTGYVGTVYVFTKVDGNWTQTAQLKPDVTAAFMGFGGAVALDGGTALVAAARDDANGVYNSGTVYVFTKSTDGTWTLAQKLNASVATRSAEFGHAVVLNGKTAIITAPKAEPGGIYAAGAVYVFSESGGIWSETATFSASDATRNAQLGNAIAASGSTVAVGAGGSYDDGAVYIFTQSSGVWSQTQKLPGIAGAGTEFGSAIAMDEDTLVVGAPRTDDDVNSQGTVYVFSVLDGTWTQSAQLTAADAKENDDLGRVVALFGSTILAGATPDTGVTAYQFSQADDGSWTQTAELVVNGATEFGFALAFDEAGAVIGKPQDAKVFFESQADLGLAVDQPPAVEPGDEFVSNIIAANNDAAASPGISVTGSIPLALTYVSAVSTQGECRSDAGNVSCNFGALPANGSASAAVTWRAIHVAPETINNIVGIAGAAPELTATATTTIDDAPVASHRTLVTPQDTAANGQVHAVDQNDDPLTYAITAQPKHGVVALNDASTGAYTYTPAKGYLGADSFTFKANDGLLDSGEGAVDVTVQFLNTPPKAIGGGVSTTEGKWASGKLSASDVDKNQKLTFSLVARPKHGVVDLNSASGAFTYVPEDGFSGTDSFTFRVNDGMDNSNAAAEKVTVEAVESDNGSIPPSQQNQSSDGDGGIGATGPLVFALLGLLVMFGMTRRRHIDADSNRREGEV